MLRCRIAVPALAGLVLGLSLTSSAEARGHGGKYVTYNGSGFGTYPLARATPLQYRAPTYVGTTSAYPGYATPTYAAPARRFAVMPRRAGWR